MKQSKLTSESIDRLEFIYNLDSDVVLNNKTFESKEGLQLSIFGALSSANDVKINNYSNLILSNKIKQSDLGYIKTNKESNYPETFTSYLIANAQPPIGVINESMLMAVDPNQLGESNKSITTCNLIMNPYSNIQNNENYFEIELINELDCRISHFDNYKTVYLTWNGSGVDFRTLIGGTASDQIFSYIIDKTYGYISLYKRYIASTKLLGFNGATMLGSAPTTGSVPPEPKSLLKIRPTPRQDKKIQLNNKWFSYIDSDEESDLSVNTKKSFSNISNNILLNSEYENISATNLPVNFTSLKNQLTTENDQSRNNAFPNLKDIDHRDYTKIFSGSNQIGGNDKISLSYETHTKKVEFSKNKLTYFHMPQNIYPYEKININEAGLIESGSVGSNNPLHSDKIFKKQGGYPTNSNFGDSSAEQSGTYLCSWLAYVESLSGYHWVDRYYNSEKLSEFEALQSTSPLTYTDDFTTVDIAINDDNSVYDKSSNLTIEPGSLYAYHRVGTSDIKNAIKSIPNNIQTDLNEYKDTAGNTLQAVKDANDLIEYDFKSGNRGKTTPAKSIDKSSNFTASFHMYSDDWNKPFGYQIFGNYVLNGFGVFNKQAVTPFLVIPDTNKTYIFNSNFNLLQTIDYGADKILRQGALDDIYLAKFGSNMRKYSLTGVLKKTYSLAGFVDTFVYAGSAFDLMTLGWGRMTNLDNDSNHLLKPYTSPTVTLPNDAANEYKLYTEENSPNLANGANYILGADSIVANENGPYIGNGYMRDVDIYDNMWKELDGYLGLDYLIKTDKKANTLLALVKGNPSTINKFKTDIRGDIWILHNNSTLTKYSNDRNLLFSKTLSSTSASLSSVPLTGDKTMDFIREFDSDGLKEYCIVLEQLYTSPGSAETTCYYFNLSGEYVKQAQIPVNITQSIASNNFDGITNYDHVKREYYNEVNENKLVFKTKVTAGIDLSKFHIDEISYDVSSLKPGYHHFAYTVDNTSGDFRLYVDGNLCNENKLPVDNTYRLDETITKSFIVGASPYYNGTYLGDELKQPTYYSGSNFKLKSIHVYNKSLNKFDIKNLFILNKNITDLKWDIPTGKRGYVETVDRFFKNRLPGHISNFYETLIHSPSSLSANDLSDSYTAQINKDLKSFAPINNKQLKSTWFYTTQTDDI